METPRDLKYSKEHEWVRLEGETATVGITDFAQDQLGDIVYLSLSAAGTSVEQFGKIGEIESVKSVSELFTPIGGEISEINQAAVEEPEIINKEPYGGGWLIKLKVADAGQLDNLLSAEAYEQHTASEH
ncbi:MAG TPA: glycine cleavage system protein GcvH [Dehalococcoidia bacterium]|nr:glycine cleavage system protein GcvH [Dehalococcoidia bacterium]